MRLLAWGLAAVVLLSGCLASSGLPGLESLETYRFQWGGSQVHVPGTPHGGLAVVHNPGSGPVDYLVFPDGMERLRWAPVQEEGWDPPRRTVEDTGPHPWRDGRPFAVPHAGDGGPGPYGSVQRLEPDGRALWAWEVEQYRDPDAAGFVVLVGRAESRDGLTWFTATEEGRILGGTEVRGPGERVHPGDQVRTVTVGVWLNGTSFYTNSRDLLEDPAFPAGGHMDRDLRPDPLPVYVYRDSPQEQPTGSRDNCRSVTISGYNALLKTQAEGSTGVRFLAPEEAYTRPGAEDHFLHGDALVFLNTVVAHDGATGPADLLPDPTGRCFEPAHAVPSLPLP